MKKREKRATQAVAGACVGMAKWLLKHGELKSARSWLKAAVKLAK